MMTKRRRATRLGSGLSAMTGVALVLGLALVATPGALASDGGGTTTPEQQEQAVQPQPTATALPAAEPAPAPAPETSDEGATGTDGAVEPAEPAAAPAVPADDAGEKTDEPAAPAEVQSQDALASEPQESALDTGVQGATSGPETSEVPDCTGDTATFDYSMTAAGEAAVTVERSGCSTGTVYQVSSYTLDQSAANTSTVFGTSNPTSYPQSLFEHGEPIVLPPTNVLVTSGDTFTSAVAIPECGDYQVDLYTGAKLDTVTVKGHGSTFRAGGISLQDECQDPEPALFCPGIDDDTDYRELFEYEYFAGTAEDGYIALGSTVDWTDQVKVEKFTAENPDAIESMMIRAIVTLKADTDITTGECVYDFSLASYEAQGPTFGTSGNQVFLGHDTDAVTAEQTEITLDVPLAECFGQSDLYKGTTVYDGANTPRGPVPGPMSNPITADGNLIASWGGGAGCEQEPGETVATASAEAVCEGDRLDISVDLDNTLSDQPAEFEVSVDGVVELVELVEVPAGGADARSFDIGSDDQLDLVVAVGDDVLLAEVFDGEECSLPPGGTVPPSVSPSVPPSVSPSEMPTEPTDGGSGTPTEPTDDGSGTPSETPSVVVTTDDDSTTVAVAVSSTPSSQFRVLAQTGIELWAAVLIGAMLLLGGAVLVGLSGRPAGRHHH